MCLITASSRNRVLAAEPGSRPRACSSVLSVSRLLVSRSPSASIDSRRAPGQLRDAAGAPTRHLGLLVLDGVVGCDVVLEDVISTELVGAGDILRPWSVDGPERMLAADEAWMVLADCRVGHPRPASGSSAGTLSGNLCRARRAPRSPRPTARPNAGDRPAHPRRSPSPGHLPSPRRTLGTHDPRRGLIPLNISHRLLGQLIGARRPTVSTAVSELARQGCIERRPDGGWILHPDYAKRPRRPDASCPAAPCGRRVRRVRDVRDRAPTPRAPARSRVVGGATRRQRRHRSPALSKRARVDRGLLAQPVEDLAGPWDYQRVGVGRPAVGVDHRGVEVVEVDRAHDARGSRSPA